MRRAIGIALGALISALRRERDDVFSSLIWGMFGSLLDGAGERTGAT